MTTQFLVDKANINTTQVAQAETQTCAPGQVRLHVDRFALTANNITYGVAGDLIGYWKFFPATEPWGQIPVWGIGTVSESQHPIVTQGTRYYGYYPMSTDVLVTPDKVSPRGFADASSHRAELPLVYNQYSQVTADNGFPANLDNHAMLYRPLFTTSFVLDDFFADNNFFGAKTLILGSASSKTAFGLAFMLRNRPVKVVGLTSAGNVDFCSGTGLYDQVVTYANVESLDQAPSAYVDMAGNREVLGRVHHHLADNLVNSCGVGITHWESRDGAEPASLPGAKPSMFFAPTQIVKRQQEMGAAVYQQKIGDATAEFMAAVDAWVTIEEHPFATVADVYQQVLQGASPNRGFVVTND